MYPDFKKILLIQFRPIGDVLLCTPLISQLRKRFPDAHIAFMVEPLPGQILDNNPDLDDIILYRHKKDDILGSLNFFRTVGRQRWDLAIDMLGTPGTAWAAFFSGAPVRVGYSVRIRKYAYTVRVDTRQPERYSPLKKLSLIKAVGVDSESPELTLLLGEAEIRYADNFYKNNKIDRNRFTVCLAPGSKRPARGWRLDGWAELGDMLGERYDANVIIVWGPGEEKDVQVITSGMRSRSFVIPLTTLREMAAIIQQSHLTVSNCSGTQHLATAVGTPTISIHGPTTPRTWVYPEPERHRFVQGNVPCIECNLPVCSFAEGTSKHMDCMKSVTAEKILNEIEFIPELQRFKHNDAVRAKRIQSSEE